MSEEVETTETMSEQDPANNANLRHQLEEAQAKIAELSPFAVSETVRKVGLDPNKGDGLVLKDLLGDDASEEKAQELVAKYGWEPASPKPELTPEESAAVAGEQRKAALLAATTSDGPPSKDQAIAEAEAAGDYGLSGRLKLQQFLSANQ